MKRSTLATVILAPVWIPLAALGLVCGVASWPFRAVGLSMAWALDKLGDWVMSFDDRNTKSECVDSTGAVYVVGNGVVRRANPEVKQ